MHSCVFARSGRAAHLNILLPVDLRAARRALSRLTHPSRVVVACASRVGGALGVSLPRVKRGRGAEEKRGGRRTSWSRGRSQNRWPHRVMYTSPSQMGFKHALHVCWKCAMASEETRARASLTLGGDLFSFDSSPGVTQSPAVQLALLDSWRKLQAFTSPRRFFGSILTLFADYCPYKRILEMLGWPEVEIANLLSDVSPPWCQLDASDGASCPRVRRPWTGDALENTPRAIFQPR